MLTAPPFTLAPGDRAPNFALPDHEGKVTMFYERVVGRPVTLLFFPPVQPPLRPPALLAVEKAAEQFEAAGVEVYAITGMPPQAVQAIKPKVRVWADPEGKVSQAFLTQLGAGLDGGAVAAVLDANQRLLRVLSGTADLARRILDVYADLPPHANGRVCRANAPVLVMPRLLDQTMCDELIAMFEQGEVVEGTVAAVDAGGEAQKVRHTQKKRLDHAIMDPGLNRILQQTIGRRLAPELEKAFNFQGFQFDRFLVCRYAADRQDRFRTHRDNLAPSNQDRRFAMTANLNGDDYEGGELTFPEYGPDRYKTGNGGAVIFSCSLLHEALPVTRGVRYALLTFLRTPRQKPAQRR